MNNTLEQVSSAARSAVQARDWGQVRTCAREILSWRRDSSEGHFLLGLVDKAANEPARAIKAFSKALKLDEKRYDAAIELADQYLRTHQYNAGFELLQDYESYLKSSPRYLDMAATIYTNIGLPEKAWPLYKMASELQQGVDSLQAKLAACSVFVGKIDDARDIYRQLLKKYPDHQRNHYELSRIERAVDSTHIDQMNAALRSAKLAPEKNIYIHYALGKELEDLEQWDEAFQHYKLAGDAAASVANYDAQTDTRLIDKVIEVCDEDWMAGDTTESPSDEPHKTPIFIVGLPRTGTTLTERILSCHSMVESVGETYFVQIALKRVSGIDTTDGMNSKIVEAAAKKDIRRIESAYRETVSYKLGDKLFFTEKFPENFLYLGFIAKAFPRAKIIHLNRNPMDTCFAMYKQSFFRHAYTLDDLGTYYTAYTRLHQHWQQVLGNRLIEVHYEDLVADQEGQTHRLLKYIGLDFEEACLKFEQNRAASDTASTVQVREKIHSRSVNRWRHFEGHLRPLRVHLENAGIDVSSSGR